MLMCNKYHRFNNKYMFDSELVFMGFLTYNFNYLYTCVSLHMDVQQISLFQY